MRYSGAGGGLPVMEVGDDDLGVMHELVIHREVALDKADTPHLEA